MCSPSAFRAFRDTTKKAIANCAWLPIILAACEIDMQEDVHERHFLGEFFNGFDYSA